MKSINDLYNQIPDGYKCNVVMLLEKKYQIDFTGVDLSVPIMEIRCFLHNVATHYSGSHDYLNEGYVANIKPLIAYIQGNSGEIESLRKIEEKFLEKYTLYLFSNGYPIKRGFGGGLYNSKLLSILTSIKHFLIDAYDDHEGLDRDIWHLDTVNISPSRINSASHISRFHFHKIKNEENKQLYKHYIKHLLLHTNTSLSTIQSRLNHLACFLLFIGDKQLQDLTRHDAEKYLEHLNSKPLKNKTFNTYLFCIILFLNYCVTNEDIKNVPFYFSDTKSEKVKDYLVKPVEQEVINQIFKILDRIDETLCCMFLVLYCTGMRVSEVCMIKRNSFYKNNKGCFIQFYQSKMRKEVVNPIPPALYEKLEQLQKKNTDTRRGKQNLFLTVRGYPYQSQYYKDTMKAVLKEHGIVTEAGEEYNFRPHSFRHNYASALADHDLPLAVIQHLLHHESAMMALVYIERTDQSRQRKYFDFINIHGKQVEPEWGTFETSLRAEWLKKYINVQALPNGVCALPVHAGKCPNGPNVCLTCEEFRTDRRYLKILKLQLERTLILLETARLNNWIRQIETLDEVRDNLTSIIFGLLNCE